MTRWLGIVGLLVTLALVGGNQVQRSNDAHRQLDNRVKNVGTWCGAIDTIIDYNRDRAAERRRIDPTVKPYTLKRLDCEAIKQKTRDSGAPSWLQF